MKILLIAPGASFHTIRWMERLQDSGFEVVLYAQDNVIPAGKFKVVKKSWSDNGGILKNPILNLFREYKALKNVIENELPDLIHLHWLFSPTAIALSFVRHKRIVGTPWGSDLLPTNEKSHWGRRQKLIYKISLKKIIRSIDHFTCDADHMKLRLIELGANPDSIEIVYFGTDSQIFSPQKRSHLLREKWGAISDDIVILSTRHFFPVYDIPTLIRAFCLVNRKFSNTFLVLGGGGDELENLKRQIADIGIEKRVRFLGHLENDEFVKSIASADIYVSTSTSDGGLASSVAEAMASQLPVVVTQFGENEKWINERNSGLSFPIGDSGVLAENLEKLILDPELRVSMGKAGRATVIEKLNPLAESLKLKDFYLHI